MLRPKYYLILREEEGNIQIKKKKFELCVIGGKYSLKKPPLLKKSFDAWNTTVVIKYILYCSSQHMDCVDGCDVTVPGGLRGVDSVTMHSVLTGDRNSKSSTLHGNL